MNSNSQHSIEDAKSSKLEKDKSLKRMITFSSEIEQFLNKKNKPVNDNINYSYEEFDEHSNVSERIQVYDCEMIGHQDYDLKASKNKMNFEEFKRNMDTPQPKRMMKLKMQMDKTLQIFGLNNRMSKVPAKELEEKESPKFSTCSDKEDSTTMKKLGRSLLKPSTFSNQRIQVTSPRKSKRCFVVDATAKYSTTFKMICQTLNCKLEQVNNCESARIIYEKMIR